MASTRRSTISEYNEGRSLTGLENDTPHMHPELLEHLWVHFFNNIHSFLIIFIYSFLMNIIKSKPITTETVLGAYKQ